MVQVLVQGVLQRGDNLHIPGKNERLRHLGLVPSCQGHSGGLRPHGLHPHTWKWLGGFGHSPPFSHGGTVMQPAPCGCGPPPPQAACMWTHWDLATVLLSSSFIFPHSAVWLWVFLCVCGFFSKMSYMATFCLSDLMLGSRPGDLG